MLIIIGRWKVSNQAYLSKSIAKTIVCKIRWYWLLNVLYETGPFGNNNQSFACEQEEVQAKKNYYFTLLAYIAQTE